MADLDSKAYARILRESFGNVTMIIHHEGGVSNLVESMIMKSDPNELAGLTLKTLSTGSLVVAKIRDGSKFSNSLLNTGDAVLTINGSPCAHLGTSAAADLIKNSPEKVTVLARTLRETGVVVAQLSDRQVLASTSTTANNNNPTAAPRRNNNNSNDDEMEQAKSKAVACFATLLMVAVVIGVTVGLTDEENNSYR